jgi:ActR/RegA family two-component response regulator
MPYTVLLVDPDSGTLARHSRALDDAGFFVATCRSFETALPRLQFMPPDVLITATRLGARNGVHLVIIGRSQHPTMQAIVLDDVFDVSIGRDARAEGAVYMERPATPEALVGVATVIVATRAPRAVPCVPRQWPRKELIEPLLGQVGKAAARILDLSYGGLRLELAATMDDTPLKGQIEVSIPGAGVRFATAPIWTRRLRPGAPWWCGVAVPAANDNALTAWRAFVDSAI